MAEKTFSQKVARALEILDYFLLLPTAFGLLYAAMLIVVVPWIGLPIFAFAGYGFFLMTRYFKHSRGRLSEKQTATMWIGTAIYNFIMFAPCICYSFSYLRPFQDTSEAPKIAVLGLILVGYITIIVFSISAYLSNNAQKYR